MTKYIIRRLLGIIPTLLVIITISFFIVRVAPGGPFDGERALPEVVKRNIEAKYHMDDPLLIQYGLPSDTRTMTSTSIFSRAYPTP